MEKYLFQANILNVSEADKQVLLVDLKMLIKAMDEVINPNLLLQGDELAQDLIKYCGKVQYFSKQAELKELIIVCSAYNQLIENITLVLEERSISKQIEALETIVLCLELLPNPQTRYINEINGLLEDFKQKCIDPYKLYDSAIRIKKHYLSTYVRV